MHCTLLTSRSMVLAIDIMHGHGLSPVRTKKTKAVLVVNAVKGNLLYALYIANKTECFSFKSGCVIWVAKCLKEDWFTVLQWQLYLKTTVYPC